MKNLQTHRIRAVAVAAAIASATLGLTGCGALSGDTEFTADFTNAAGMYVGNDVMMLGVSVGEITKIEPKGEIVRVSIEVDGDVKLPQDLFATQVTPSLITDRHVDLSPAYSGKGPTLDDGAHLDLDHTKSPVELDRVLKKIDTLAAALKGDGKKGPLSGDLLVQILEGKGAELEDIVTNVDAALKLGVDNKDQLTEAVIKLSELSKIIADNDQAVRDFSERTTRLTGLLAEQAPGLEAVLTQLNDALNNTAAGLSENQERLGSAITTLGERTDQLRANARNLTEFIDIFPLLMQNLDNAVTKQHKALRLRLLTDKTLLDNEVISVFCERLGMRQDGCRTGKIKDFGPDFGLAAAILGLEH